MEGRVLMSDYNANPNPDTDRIRQVAFGYRIAPESKLKVDQFSTLDTDKVYSFTQLIGKTRLRVLVDPSLIPH